MGIRTMWSCDVEDCPVEEVQGNYGGMPNWDIGIVAGRTFVVCPQHKGVIQQMQPSEKIKAKKRP
ncbi:MAG TPA: hypothetical protein VFI56_23215 [Vicinamibacterales bacterium]|nr:hypothetical protein [Vicinamibacterales bacterium]